MSDFEIYFSLGFRHICDFSGYDHILFIIALCAPCRLNNWKHLFVLITAFTIGHSVTLALSTLGLVIIRSDIIEFLIPVTIFVTCIINITGKSEKAGYRKFGINYVLTLFFGLIHGMGFSNYLRMLLGKEESIFTPLFAFNIGLEAGQLLIVAIIFALTFILMKIFKIAHKKWNYLLSGVVGIFAIMLICENRFW